MNKDSIDNGGPAFPCERKPRLSIGMTLRDYFAGQALQALVYRDADDSAYGGDMIKARPQLAYSYADAMIAARNQAAK